MDKKKRDYQKQYRIKNRHRLLLYSRQYTKTHLKETRMRANKWRIDNPDKRRLQYIKDYEKERVRRIVRHAVRDGKIKKLPCENCGAKKIVHAHHPDYSKPLQVQWLCPPHHMELHRT
jgi:CRISPR/Cas system-associated protein Cas5 (RAMP superfamily)